MPIDVEELLSSPRFQAFKDFKKWWFMAVLFAMWNQRKPGYLEMTGNLYQIVGAHSRPMWEAHGGEVMAAFERVKHDGKEYLYSPKVEGLWNTQQNRYSGAVKRASRKASVLLSINSLPIDEIYKSYPRQRGKDKALKAIEKAIQKIAREKKIPEIEAAEFLHKATLEFAKSPAGNKGEYTPYPASWFNSGDYLSDRSEWYREDKKQKLANLDELYGKDKDS